MKTYRRHTEDKVMSTDIISPVLSRISMVPSKYVCDIAERSKKGQGLVHNFIIPGNFEIMIEGQCQKVE